MFTGIIEEVGTIKAIKRGRASSKVTITADVVMSDLSLGDSLAVDGICLTVSEVFSMGFCADVMHETLSRSTLGKLTYGSRINLERALSAQGRFGGHIVTGHIDGCGTIVKIESDDIAVWITVETDESLMRYIVSKGSIALDGISLTVARVNGNGFSVSLIPRTLKETALNQKRVGSMVNLETDIIGKYVEHLLHHPPSSNTPATTKSSITGEFLLSHGF